MIRAIIGSSRSNTPEDVVEGVVAGKYRLLLFLPLKQFKIAASGDISFGRSMLTD